MFRLVLSSFLSIAVATIVGCGSEDPEPSATSDSTSSEAPETKVSTTSEKKAATFDTPKAAFDAFVQASKAGEWPKVINVLSQESQTMFTASMVMDASFSTTDKAKQESLDQLLKKHGIDVNAEPEPGDENAGPESLIKSVKDLPALVSELSKWMSENADDSDSGFMEVGELGEVTIDGDIATAQVDSERGMRPIEFRKVDGSWVVHLPKPGRGEPESVSDSATEDDGTPGIGTLWIGDEAYKLREATAYRSKFFDDPCTVVLLTARKMSPKQLEGLKKMLAKDGNDDSYFARGPHVKLTLDKDGKLMSLFAWADSISISSNSGVEVTVKIDGNRISGKAARKEPKKTSNTKLRFEAEFDTEMLAADK